MQVVRGGGLGEGGRGVFIIIMASKRFWTFFYGVSELILGAGSRGLGVLDRVLLIVAVLLFFQDKPSLNRSEKYISQ